MSTLTCKLTGCCHENESPDMLSLVYDIIDTCRGEDDEWNHNLPLQKMASKITPKITISQILICRTNILSPITFSRPTWRQPKQRLQLHFHEMQCPRDFFMGSMHHPIQNAMSTSFLCGSKCHPRQWWILCENGPLGTANTSFACMELTCPPCVRLWGPWKNMFHVMSHKKRAQIGHVISVFLMFLACHL